MLVEVTFHLSVSVFLVSYRSDLHVCSSLFNSIIHEIRSVVRGNILEYLEYGFRYSGVIFLQEWFIVS